MFDDLEKTLRFWLERGVDGFRIDVAHGMAKPPGLPDMEITDSTLLRISDDDPRFNHEGVHDIHRGIRSVLNDYPDAVSIGEVWVHDNARFAEYLRADELHLGFNFRLLQAEFDAADDPRTRSKTPWPQSHSRAPLPTWTLESHDAERTVTRYGGGEIGLARARAMAQVMLALPGAAFIYNGEELGLPNVDLPDEALQDPVWERSGHTRRGRDGCRVPMPWAGRRSAVRVLRQPGHLAADPAGVGGADGREAAGRGRLDAVVLPSGTRIARAAEPNSTAVAIEWLGSPRDGLVFRLVAGGLVCALNAGTRPMTLPDGELILASAALVDGKLPPNAAAWLV